MRSMCHTNVLNVSKNVRNVSPLTSGVSRKGHTYLNKHTLSAARGQQKLKG